MKTVADIVVLYQKAWHSVDWLMIKEVQSLTDEKILQILLTANGRDIVVKEQVGDGVYDGQGFEYIGKEDTSFDWWPYFE